MVERITCLDLLDLVAEICNRYWIPESADTTEFQVSFNAVSRLACIQFIPYSKEERIPSFKFCGFFS